MKTHNSLTVNEALTKRLLYLSVIERKFQSRFVPSVVTMASRWRDVKRSQIPGTQGQSREIRRENETNSTERSVVRRQQSLLEVSGSLCNPNGYNGARNCPPLDISHMTSHSFNLVKPSGHYKAPSASAVKKSLYLRILYGSQRKQ